MTAANASAAPVVPPTAAPGPLLDVVGLRVYFPMHEGLFRSRPIRAVDGVDLTVDRGEVLGLVGESGSGKSTIGRAVVQIQRPTEGEVRLDGVPLGRMGKAELRRQRGRLQMVFQDPYSSLNPRHRIADIIGEPLLIQGRSHGAASERAKELLTLVGLSPDVARRYPHALSGGQRQRVAVARALAPGPELIVCDEPVSALDVSTQAQIVNLLRKLQRELNLALLFIAHDLAVVRRISSRIAVMYLGKVVETGASSEIYGKPLHPYTIALLSAVPVPDAKRARSRKRIVLLGDIPSPADPPSGCRFRTRCPWVAPICSEAEPPLRTVEDRAVACHFAGQIDINTPRAAAPESIEQRQI